MSLKGFHILFVMATVSLSVFFGIWAYNQYTMYYDKGYLVTTFAAFLTAVGFIFYGIVFAKKIKV